jgi:hypothetical protein
MILVWNYLIRIEGMAKIFYHDLFLFEDKVRFFPDGENSPNPVALCSKRWLPDSRGSNPIPLTG